MKLQHYDLENAIDFDKSSVWTLVCESPRQFAKITADLCILPRDKDIGWQLYDGKQLDISKYLVCLVDFHNVSLNDKKSTNVLQEHLRKMAYDEEHTVATHEAISVLTKYLNDLAGEIDYPTCVNDVDLGVILKCVSITFLDESQSLCEKLMDYTTLISRLTPVKVLACINLRSYLETEELEKFFKHCEQCCINLLCVENCYKHRLDGEKILYSDRDMCEFFPK